MKKILASIMMGSLIFCLSACNMPWQKKDTQKEVKREVIQADKAGNHERYDIESWCVK